MWKLIKQRLISPSVTRDIHEILDDAKKRAGASHEPVPATDLTNTWQKRIATAFGGSLHVRHVDTGSCNACEWELTALLNPVYDVQRLGIDFVASPRHADVLIVTGGLTRNLAEALQATYEATASPKAVIALGDCACGCGLLGQTYAQQGEISTAVPVLLNIPGCPPHPHTIIAGLMEAMRLLEEGRKTSGHPTTAV